MRYLCTATYATTTYQVAEDVDIIRGAHQISVGANYIHLQLNATGNNASNGQFTFNGSNTGYGLADFLLGQVSGFTQSNPQRQNERQNYISPYVQDAWRVNRRLTVNAGVRWEPYLPQYDRYARGSHFELSDFLANKRSGVFSNGPAGATFHGDAGLPRSNTLPAYVESGATHRRSNRPKETGRRRSGHPTASSMICPRFPTWCGSPARRLSGIR